MAGPGAATIVDAHCHLADRAFDSDRDAVVARAREAGIVAAVVVGEDFEDNRRVLEAAAADPFILPALGHHPWRIDRASRDVPRTLRLLEEHRGTVVAVGEVGLDYRTACTAGERADQRAVFREFIEAAKWLGLPLSVHVRSAGHYVIEMLRETEAGPAVLHAFDGRASYALEGARTGLHFSIPATVLVSAQKQKLVRALPLDRLLLESDAPALSPERDARNEPTVMLRSLEKIAELKGISPESLADAALKNTKRIFNLAH